MNADNIAALINLLGFTTGVALYALLGGMVLRHPATALRRGANVFLPARGRTHALLLATAALGLIWNVGALVSYGARDFGGARAFPLLLAAAYTALGFLPAVVVQLALHDHAEQTSGSRRRGAQFIVFAAYALSATAGALHFSGAWRAGDAHSLAGLRALTFGYGVLLPALLFVTRRRQKAGSTRAVWASALAIFAVTALHLSHHDEATGAAPATAWWVWEITGHHASLPLVLAILYTEYRFAFADLFLKRALSLLLLVALAFGLYVAIAAPFLQTHNSGVLDAHTIALMLTLWVVTALAYARLRGWIERFVDSVILRRADYALLRAEVTNTLNAHDDDVSLLDALCAQLAPALSAQNVTWQRADEALPTDAASAFIRDESAFAESYVATTERSTGAGVLIPTHEKPRYLLVINILTAGRRILSADEDFLNAIAILTARRIDAMRVTRERYAQKERERAMRQLTAEAQLRALRAQINPHFLFNALTTIGYLIQAAPERALATLLKLTNLLRRVLRTNEDFVTLEDELTLIKDYLAIEQARFEERLRVRFIVPDELLCVRVPSLLLQPLAENAVKHGIAPQRAGGEIIITARLTPNEMPSDGKQLQEQLRLTVEDTGAGFNPEDLARKRAAGVGLTNVEERLRAYFGTRASLRLTSNSGGACAAITLPLSDFARQTLSNRTTDGVTLESPTTLRVEKTGAH